jgi:membrane-associated phospholipid phosphatase
LRSRTGTTGRRLTRRRSDVGALLGGLAVLVMCSIPASSGRVGSLEQQVFEAVNGLSDALEPPAHAAQFLGVLAIGPVIALIAFITRRPRLAVAALLATAAKLLAERVLWEFVQRERPAVTEPAAIIRAGSATTGLSFVSGHVVLVTALAWVTTPYLPRRWRILPWIVVALVAFARIYLGAHNPLDVIGGLGMGVAIGGAINLALRVPSTSGSIGIDRPLAELDRRPHQ